MKKSILLIVVSLLSLTACEPPPLWTNVNRQVSQSEHHLQQLQNKTQSYSPAVIERKDSYIDLTPIDLQHVPAWFSKHIQLHGQNIPFRILANKIVTVTGSACKFQKGVNINHSISMDYTGPVSGALAKLATLSGYSYNVNNNTVIWSAFVTKTFDVSFVPGDSNYLVGKNQERAPNYASNNSNALSPSEYSNLVGNISVWHDIAATFNKLKSTHGKVEVSQATTSVTVYDTPENIRIMSNYIKQLNNRLSQEVMIQIHVIEVQLHHEFSYGVNWNLVANKLAILGNTASPINFTPLGKNDDGSLGIRIGIINGADIVKVLLKVLQQQGRVATETYPRVVTMNNQVAEIGINTQTSYIRETSTTSGFQSTTTAIKPGIVNEGFTLFVLPKIQKQHVFLQISSTLSHLINLQSKDFKDHQGNTTSSIQLPQVSYKRFNQRTVVPNGATLVLAGFKQLKNEANQTGFFGSWQLGSKGASQNNIETIVLITPIIIRK